MAVRRSNHSSEWRSRRLRANGSWAAAFRTPTTGGKMKTLGTIITIAFVLFAIAWIEQHVCHGFYSDDCRYGSSYPTTPSLGWCNPNMISCGYDNPKRDGKQEGK
jgi:hypothetical protein